MALPRCLLRTCNMYAPCRLPRVDDSTANVDGGAPGGRELGKRERARFRLLSLMTSGGPVPSSSASSASATASLLERLLVHTYRFLRG